MVYLECVLYSPPIPPAVLRTGSISLRKGPWAQHCRGHDPKGTALGTLPADLGVREEGLRDAGPKGLAARGREQGTRSQPGLGGRERGGTRTPRPATAGGAPRDPASHPAPRPQPCARLRPTRPRPRPARSAPRRPKCAPLGPRSALGAVGSQSFKCPIRCQ